LGALTWARPPRLSESALRSKEGFLARAATERNTNRLSRVLA